MGNQASKGRLRPGETRGGVSADLQALEGAVLQKGAALPLPVRIVDTYAEPFKELRRLERNR